MSYKGDNLMSVKRTNRSVALRALHEKGAMSRKRLAECMNLTPAAITKIVGEMISDGLISEGEMLSSGNAGRREILIDEWSTIPCFIEGHNIDDIAAIYSLAQCLTSRIYEANQHDRERLHIAGVFANNYTNLMYRIAEDVLKDTQIPFNAILPLIDQTAAKMHAMKPLEAQTGPAKRGDHEVMNHHLEILQTTPYAPVYQSLAALIEKAHSH